MNFMAKVAQMLGLKPDASEADILAAMSAEAKADKAEPARQAALQAQLTAIGTALGVTSGDGTAILAAAQAKSAALPDEVVALQVELATITTEFKALRDGGMRDKATAFVDGAIRAGHVGVRPSRDRFIALHMSDPAGTEDIIGKIPVLGPSGATLVPPVSADGTIALNADEIAAACALGRDPKLLAELMADDRKKGTV